MKAILVIDDMPNDCLECPCYRQTKDGRLFEDCKAVLRPLSPAERDEVPEWCPLKPMPEKYIEREIKIETERDVEVCTHGITLGRNLLIEEIEK